MTSKAIRTIMFEDNEKLAKSLIRYFDSSGHISLVAHFKNALNAVSEVRKFEPDVVVMDIGLPGISGIEALQQIKAVLPETKVLILTVFDDEEKIFSALQSGASGYALKNFDDGEDIDILQRAIIEVNESGGHMSPTIASKVIKAMQTASNKAHYVDLTERERAVLQCMVKGENRKMIASSLHIAHDTVGDHLKKIYKKLHVNSAPEAVREAILRKLV
jgi:DNA-binding NarL/FixJ family response regulator